jgi:hypothetical protein
MLFYLAICCLTLGTVVSAQATATFVPARLLNGSLPPTPAPVVVGRIEEILEVGIDATGRVAQTTMLRASPLPTDPLRPTVANWRFQPASDQGRVIPSRVLVAAMFRPPQLDDSPTLGNPPVNLAAPSDEIPFPIVTELPPYPPLAVGDGVVLVEVLVGVDGRGRQPRIVAGAAGFDQPALAAAGRWSFRPARWNDRAVETYAYLVFGFRQPVVVAPLKPSAR